MDLGLGSKLLSTRYVLLLGVYATSKVFEKFCRRHLLVYSKIIITLIRSENPSPKNRSKTCL